MRPLMDTDSERLMLEGIRIGRDTFADFLQELELVGRRTSTRRFATRSALTHRKLMFEALGLEPSIDFPTVEMLGNTGSVALPMAMALGIEQGHLAKDDHVAMLGIGSGINVLMLAVDWQRSACRWPRRRCRRQLKRATGSVRGEMRGRQLLVASQ